MTFVVAVSEEDGGYRATPLLLPECAATAPTRPAALQAVAEALAQRLARMEIVEIEVPDHTVVPLSAAAGAFADDPDYIRGICAEAYAARDAEDPAGS